MDKELIETLKMVIREELKPINERLDSIETQVKENTQILKALQHSAEVNKAEQDNMKNDIAHIKGDVEAIKKDLTQVEMVTANNWENIAKLKAAR